MGQEIDSAGSGIEGFFSARHATTVASIFVLFSVGSVRRPARAFASHVMVGLWFALIIYARQNSKCSTGNFFFSQRDSCNFLSQYVQLWKPSNYTLCECGELKRSARHIVYIRSSHRPCSSYYVIALRFSRRSTSERSICAADARLRDLSVGRSWE